MDVAQQSRQLTSEGFTEALGVILLVATAGILVVASRFVRFDMIWSILRNDAADGPTRAVPASTRHPRHLWSQAIMRVTATASRVLNAIPSGPGMALARIITGVTAFAAITPILMVILLSFSDASFLQFPPAALSLRWYGAFLDNESWTSAALSSVVIGVLTSAFAVVVGTMAALGLARARFRGRGLVVGLILSPLVVPAVVGALSLYWVLLRLGVAGSAPVVALAHALGAVPMVVIVVAATYQTFDERLEQAARSLGASPWTAIRLVTLPLIRPGIVAATLFAFLYSFDELVYTLFLREPALGTLPIKLWGDLNFGLTPMLAVVSTIEVCVVIGVVATTIMVQQRRQRMSLAEAE